MSHYVTNTPDTSLTLGNATTVSQWINVQQGDNIGCAVRTAGTATGTWSVLYSNDFVPGVDSPTDLTKWDTYTLATTPPAASGSAQKFGIAIDAFEFKYIRLQFTGSAGAGTATIVWQMKGS